MTAPAETSPVRRLSTAADLTHGLRALAAALAALPPAVGRLRRLEAPLAVRPAALDLPAGFAPGALDPLALLGPGWSTAGATLEPELGTLDRLAEPDRWLAAHGWPEAAPELRLALSARFDPDRPAAPEWSDFGGCRVWLPTVEYDAETGVLAVNWLDRADRPDARRSSLASLAAWRARPAVAPAGPRDVVWDVDPAAAGRWHGQVTAALARIADPGAAPPLAKIVLGRRLDGRLVEPAHPADLLRVAATATTATADTARPSGWPWWLARGERSWLGESPELLGVREGGRLRTVALAGTRRRDHDPAVDAALGRELLASDKDRREQAAVAGWLRDRLAELSGREPTVGDVSLVRLPALQHLGCALEVAIDPELADGRWLAALHPTPALCGAPRVAVRRWLRETEDFDRGLYGSVVGWRQRSRAVAYVAIRGVLVEGRRVVTYAGCGLVRGSDAGQEWSETAAKIGAICRRLGLAMPGEEGAA